MSWTYDLTQIATNILYQVRLLIGDTDSTDEQLQDEEINYFVSVEGQSPYKVAIACTQAIIGKYSRLVDQSAADLRLSYSERLKSYKGLLEELKMKQTTKAAVPWAGGISISNKQSFQQNSDLVQPTFYRNQFAEPQTTVNGPFDNQLIE